MHTHKNKSLMQDTSRNLLLPLQPHLVAIIGKREHGRHHLTSEMGVVHTTHNMTVYGVFLNLTEDGLICLCLNIIVNFVGVQRLPKKLVDK